MSGLPGGITQHFGWSGRSGHLPNMIFGTRLRPGFCAVAHDIDNNDRSWASLRHSRQELRRGSYSQPIVALIRMDSCYAQNDYNDFRRMLDGWISFSTLGELRRGSVSHRRPKLTPALQSGGAKSQRITIDNPESPLYNTSPIFKSSLRKCQHSLKWNYPKHEV